MKVPCDCYPNEYTILSNLLLSQEVSGIWILKGDSGMGKANLAKAAIQNSCREYIQFETPYGEIDALAPVRSGIVSFYQRKGEHQKFPIDSFLSYAEQLKQRLFAICQNKHMILYLDDISGFQSDVTLEFFWDLLESFSAFSEIYPIQIIVIASEDLLNQKQRDFLYDISSLTPPERILRLEPPREEILLQYVAELLKRPISISQHTLKRIIQSGFGNLRYIKRVVECLKDLGTLYLEDGVWRCGIIDTEMLYNYLKDRIRIRYNKLESSLQGVLQQASATGFKIDLDLLKQPLGIFKAEQKLEKIEKISRLVRRGKVQFRFESEEVLYFIEKEIDDDRKRDLHETLAVYLESRLPRSESETGHYELRNNYFKIAKHYESCSNYKKAFSYYTKCAVVSFIIKDYLSIIECHRMSCDIVVQEEIRPQIQQLWKYLLAHANQEMGNFAEASNLWNQLIYWQDGHPLYATDLFQFKYAYCLRRAGQVMDAYDALETLKNRLKQKKSELLADILIVLTGIVDQIGHKDDKERYYNWSLDLCQQLEEKTKYYQLLGKSNMFYTPGIAIPKMKAALSFFETSSNRMEAGKIAYNLGMSFIQNNQIAEAKEPLQYALEIFTTYGSRNVSYVYCALGILYALQDDYINAKEKFISVIRFSTNQFAVITAKLNLYYCYSRLDQPHTAEHILVECEQFLMENGSDKLVLLRNLYFAKAMAANTKGKLEVCYRNICTAYEIETEKLKYNTYNTYLARWIQQLGDKLKKDIPLDIRQKASDVMSAYKERAFHQKAIWGNLMFW